MKLFVLLVLSPWRIHVLYSLAKSPLGLRTCTPMLTVSLSIIRCPERLANVTLQKRHKVSTSNPIKRCQLVPIAVQLVLRSLPKVHPYVMTNQSNICKRLR